MVKFSKKIIFQRQNYFNLFSMTCSSVMTCAAGWPFTETHAVLSSRGVYVTTSSSTCSSMDMTSWCSLTNSANLGCAEQSASNNTDETPTVCAIKLTEMSSNVVTVSDIIEHISAMSNALKELGQKYYTSGDVYSRTSPQSSDSCATVSNFASIFVLSQSGTFGNEKLRPFNVPVSSNLSVSVFIWASMRSVKLCR